MRTIQDMIAAEVRYCVSGLVSALAGGYTTTTSESTEIPDLCELAFELARPVPDYESAAVEAMWSPIGDGGFRRSALDHEEADEVTETGLRIILANSVFDACEHDNIEPHESEVFEHWAVTDWLGEKLAAHGEKVETDFYGMTIWARQTTGQAIYADTVIERIYAELSAPASEA